jgi:hypothetical protein
MTRRKEAAVQVAAPPDAVFARLDDQTRLAEHMGRPSLMIGGGRMTYAFDAQKGQAVGSHIRVGGSAFGLKLELDEVITERDPPRRKVWRTAGTPELVVIGGYEMGFELRPVAGGSELRIWIGYDLPARGPGRWLPALGDAYAQWCVTQITRDAEGAFGRLETAARR